MNINMAFYLILIASAKMFAHPNGNIIITQNGCVLWPYVSPVGDIGHHASLLLWDQRSKPRLFLKSEYEASDYFLYNEGKSIYIVERRYLGEKDIFESRILKTSINFETPKVIWPWFKDKWHIGVGGFKMLSDNKLIFVKYPDIYSLKKGQNPIVYFDFPSTLNKMRPVANERLLLLGDSKAWLTDKDGEIVKQWDDLIEELQGDIPLNRNTIYDMDYAKGNLLLAYWGKRAFELIDPNGGRKVLKQCTSHWIPHWVAFFGGKQLLFSSFLDFENGFTDDKKKTTIYPNLIMMHDLKESVVWE